MRQKKNSILLQQRQKKWQLPFLKKTKRRKARAADVERYKGIPVTKEYLNLEEKKCPVCGADLVSIGGRIRPPGTGIYTGTAEGG